MASFAESSIEDVQLGSKNTAEPYLVRAGVPIFFRSFAILTIILRPESIQKTEILVHRSFTE